MAEYRISIPRTPIKCRYLVYRFHGRPIFLPLIHVRLVSESNAISSIGLVDSGSTVTFLPYELAELLDLPHLLEDTESIGAGGPFSTFIAKLHRLQLIKGTKIISNFVDLQVHVPTEPDRIPYVILGRNSIFDRFEVIFQEKKNTLILHHHKWAGKKRKRLKKLGLS